MSGISASTFGDGYTPGKLSECSGDTWVVSTDIIFSGLEQNIFGEIIARFFGSFGVGFQKSRSLDFNFLGLHVKKNKKGFFLGFLGGFFIFYIFLCGGLLALLFHFPDFVWNILEQANPANRTVGELSLGAHQFLPSEEDELRAPVSAFGELSLDELRVACRVLLVLVKPKLKGNAVGCLVDVNAATPLALIVGGFGT